MNEGFHSPILDTGTGSGSASFLSLAPSSRQANLWLCVIQSSLVRSLVGSFFFSSFYPVLAHSRFVSTDAFTATAAAAATVVLLHFQNTDHRVVPLAVSIRFIVSAHSRCYGSLFFDKRRAVRITNRISRRFGVSLFGWDGDGHTHRSLALHT